MMRIADNKRLMIATAVVVAFIALVVPTCQMIGCSMEMSGGLMSHHGVLPTLSSNCGGEWLVNNAPDALATTVQLTLLLAVALAFVVATRLMAPQAAIRPVRVVEPTPPPPPTDPWGERFLL